MKALARRLDLPEWQQASDRERWTVTLLFNAVKALSERLNREEILHGWDAAWFLHVEGFHETRLDISQVEFRIPLVEQLVNLADGTDLSA